MKINTPTTTFFKTGTLLVALILSGCVAGVNNRNAPEPNPKKAAKTYMELGVAYMQKGRYDLAEPKLQRSLAAHPMQEAYNALALLYEELHDNALAEENYKQLVAQFPDYGLGYLNYNIFLCKYDRRAQIQQLATQMASRGKEIAAIGQIAAGNCALSKGDKIAAKRYYSQALTYEKYAAGALLPLAEIDLQDGFVAEAKNKVDLVNNYIGYSPRSVYLSVLVNRDLGNRAEERKMMNVLRSRFPRSPEAAAIFNK